MKPQTQKLSKPNIAQDLKKAASEGIHILRDVLNVLFVSNRAEYEELKKQAGPNDRVWLEEKQYHKSDNIEHSDSSEALAASRLDDVGGRGANDCHPPEAANEPVIAEPTKQERHRQMLKQQLDAFDKEQKEYGAQRAKQILISQANQSYHEWLCRNL